MREYGLFKKLKIALSVNMINVISTEQMGN